MFSLQWRHDERNSVSNHRRPDCLRNRLFTRWTKKSSKLRATGLREGNSPDQWIPGQSVSNAENVSIWWRYYVMTRYIWYWQAIKLQSQSLVCGNRYWGNFPVYANNLILRYNDWCQQHNNMILALLITSADYGQGTSFLVFRANRCILVILIKA